MALVIVVVIKVNNILNIHLISNILKSYNWD